MLSRLLQRRGSGRARADKVEELPENDRAPRISAMVAMALAHGVPYSYVELSSLDGAASDRADASGESGDPTNRGGESEPDSI